MNRPEAKSRGRPRQSASTELEMRERIVVAARELFVRDGVEAVSMRNLASAVGCSPMWLYRFFGSKQEILWHVWDAFLGELFVRLEKIDARSPRARLEKLAHGYLDYWMEYPDRFGIVFLQKDLVPGATQRYLETSDMVKRYDLFTRVAEDARTQGEFGATDPTEIAQGLLCILQGLALNFITVGDYPWRDIGSLSRLTVKSYLSGLASHQR